MAEQPDNRSSIACHTMRAFDARFASFAAELVATDFVLTCGGAAAGADPIVVLVAHIVLVAIYGWRFPPAHLHDRTPWTFCLMLVLIAGPLGGLGVALLALAERCGAPSQEVLDAWYDWLSGDDRRDPTLPMYEAIVTGREFKPALHGPRNFASVIGHGSLAEQQALLGRVGLKYHHDYFPLLSSALRSPQSAIRAQAAAVFVKLKEEFRRRLHDDRRVDRAACRGDDVSAILARAKSIVDCAQSGFLDPAEVRGALADAKALCVDAAPSGAAAVDQAMILCRIIASTGDDGGQLDRLLHCAQISRSEMRPLLARCLVATGRHVDLHRLLFADRGSALARLARDGC